MDVSYEKGAQPTANSDSARMGNCVKSVGSYEPEKTESTPNQDADAPQL